MTIDTKKIVSKIQTILDEVEGVHPKTNALLDDVCTKVKNMVDAAKHEPHSWYGKVDLDAKSFLVEDYEITIVLWIRPKDGNFRYTTHVLHSTSPIQTNPNDDWERAMGLIV